MKKIQNSKFKSQKSKCNAKCKKLATRNYLLSEDGELFVIVILTKVRIGFKA